MTGMEAEQPALDGLAPRRRRRASAGHTPAAHDPIARVVLDIQATHLGRTFDYLIDEKDSGAARPGVLVRVRFGGRRVNGVIWERAAASDTPRSALRYLERVLGGDVLVPASMRRDITLIADAYGGTRANILRLAVPPRVAKVEKEQRLVAGFARGGEAAVAASAAGGFAGRAASPAVDAHVPGTVAARIDARYDRLAAQYDAGVRDLHDALHARAFRSFVFDPLPGVGRAVSALAWMAAESLAAGHTAVVVLPGMRETRDVLDAMGELGFAPFGPGRSGTGGWTGDVAVLSAGMPPMDRYRAYLAIATGQVRCAIGPRAAMYAPVDGPGLFAIMDDAAYQQADGMMPYAHARGVLRLRAQAHGGVFVALANARSPLSQMEVAGLPGVAPRAASTAVSGPSTPVRPLPSVLKDASPWVRWLNREELARLADPSIGARVPHVAVGNIRQALQSGPVLFSIPADGVAETLSCANPKCLRQARCRRCTGPLQRVHGNPVPRCRWCGAAASNWTCPHCHGERLRVVRVGAAGTADELRGLFRNVPVLLSSPSQPGGVIGEIDHRPLIVIATPGAEPRVRAPGTPGVVPAGDAREVAVPRYVSYAAVAILDAWTSLYTPGLDARVDALSTWMRVVSMCASRERGGQALLLGETDPAIAQSLMLWDPTLLASRELEERLETGMPPAVSVACVWGRRDAVDHALHAVGVLGGDLAVCPMPGTGGVASELPGVLGPVPIPQPRTVDARELEVTADRVRAVIRVPHAMREELAARLRRAVARHVAARETGELRFQLDRKDLI
ncbi:primosomal protein N' family DNA-binding protein [Bifidobacterium platyrrhinorum]|uniref:Primosomal protein N n=1 Tax=Bifidobacterium platyrrhinorum TaxID=2661628 RepID=A0A6L9SNX7_9BIFI|nr:primosomal protein N' [Bifidobacterium platyrrhinorum]NEG54236.1 primosomal protein N' [Bifidobacterium platyrrhinorum]